MESRNKWSIVYGLKKQESISNVHLSSTELANVQLIYGLGPELIFWSFLKLWLPLYLSREMCI